VLAGVRAHRLALLVFLIALGVRLLYLRQAAAVPFSSNPITDGAQYWSWAERIVAGDWRGEGVFYQAPLYPYLLAVVRAIFGPNLAAVYVLQATLSALGCALLAAAGRRVFSPVVGIIAGIMAACYAPTILFDGVVQKEAIAVFVMSALCWMIAVSMAGIRPSLCAAMGVALGLLALLRENSLLLAPLLIVWIWEQARGASARARWLPPACLAAGMVIVLLPVALRNLVVGGELALTTSQMGTNFYIGNSTEATGTYIELVPGRGSPEFEQADAVGLAERRLGRRLTPREASQYWLGESFKFIRSEPLVWLRLMSRKTLLFWNRYEVSDAEDLYFYQRWSWLLRGLAAVWNFGTLFPLAAAGVCLTWPRRRELWLLHALVLTTSISVIAFYVFGRYRLPIVPLLILFAAVGAVEAAKAIAARRWRPLTVASAAVLSAGLLARVPLFDPQQPLAGSFYAWSIVSADAGRMDEAIAAGREAIRLDPTMPEAHYVVCRMLSGKNEFVEALAECRMAVNLRPTYPKAWNDLGILLALTDDRRGAADALIRSLEQDPDDAAARKNLRQVSRAAGQANERDVQSRIESFLRERSRR
jgi:4-amino-4-deoxy-L-arabinose transferase-like glycosyltransferase